jgi:hypothetical protein
VTFESFDPLEEAAWQHSLLPTAHTDRITQRKRDFLAGAAWTEKNSPLAAAVRQLQSKGCSLVTACDSTGQISWRVVESLEKRGDLSSRPSFPDPIAALLDFAVSK